MLWSLRKFQKNIYSKTSLNYNTKNVNRYFSSTVTDTIDSIISVNEANKLLYKKNVKFFDIRDPNEYAKSHIPGALNLNDVFSYLATSDEKGVKDLQITFEELFQDSGLNKDDHAILYEDALNTRFGASCRGWYLLNLLGHRKVSVLDGGWKKWVGAGLAQDSSKVNIVPGNFEASWDKSFWADKYEVLNVITNKNSKTKLLDVRDTVEWKGDSSSPYGIDFVPRKGRLTGAIHLMWSDLLTTKDGITNIKEGKEVVDILSKKGIKTDDDIIIYCFKGARASNSYLALKRAGFSKIKNYFGSWNEWARDPKLPIDDSKL